MNEFLDGGGRVTALTHVGGRRWLRHHTPKRFALLVVLLLAACGRNAAVDKPLTPVEVITIAGAQSSNSVRYSASVKPDWQLDLAFRAGGYVDDIHAQEGDRVRRGAVLARVRDSDYAGKVSAGRGQVAEATAGLTKAKSDFDRAQKLFSAAALTKPELDAARAQLDAAQARLQMAEASSRDAQLAFGDASLVAPADGVVLKRSVERGSLVGPGVPVFTLAGTSKVKVVFGVPDLIVSKMKIADELAVTIEALHRNYAGRVSRIAPSADAKSRMFEVELSIANPQDELKPGMIASLKTNDEKTPQLAAVVPLESIVRAQNDGYAVFVVDGNDVVHVRRVSLGDMFGNAIAVSNGVATGERVVTRGATIVADGDRVQVMP